MIALRPTAGLLITSLVLAATGVFTAHAAQMQFTQQGPKLVGTGYSATSPQQGASVVISADGNTIIVGGHGDLDPSTRAQVSAAWVFARGGSGAAGAQQERGPQDLHTRTVHHSARLTRASCLPIGKNTGIIFAHPRQLFFSAAC
jgi:hypothetical protein